MSTKFQKVIKLKRRPFSDHVLIEYEGGTSDYLPHKKAFDKLKEHGVKDPEKILDYVWNFYKATIVVDL